MRVRENVRVEVGRYISDGRYLTFCLFSIPSGVPLFLDAVPHQTSAPVYRNLRENFFLSARECFRLRCGHQTP
jgi:hypothetical protein